METQKFSERNPTASKKVFSSEFTFRKFLTQFPTLFEFIVSLPLTRIADGGGGAGAFFFFLLSDIPSVDDESDEVEPLKLWPGEF